MIRTMALKVVDWWIYRIHAPTATAWCKLTHKHHHYAYSVGKNCDAILCEKCKWAHVRLHETKPTKEKETQ